MKPNVCLVVLDAVRAANLSCYGHDRPTTPHIDDVAEESLVFDRAVSPGATTLDSVSSLFSGLYPGEHRAGENGSLSVDVPHLPELLSRRGYHTGAITTNPFVTPGFGFERGVDEFHSVEYRFQDGLNARKFFDEKKHLPAYQIYLRFLPAALKRNFLSSVGNALQFRFDLFTGSDQGAKQATSQARRFLSDADSPWFLYLHYSEAHMKNTEHLYTLPGDRLYRFVDEEVVRDAGVRRDGGEHYDASTRDVHERLYDATLRYLDDHVGTLVDELKRSGRWEETLFVVTADHGECLGRHGHVGHGTLYEPGIHVPLLVKPPADMDVRPGRVEERRNVLGLFQTVADVSGGSAQHASVGSVVERRREPVLVQDYCATWDWSRYGTEEATGQHAVYRDEVKLIRRGEHVEGYDLAADPEERTPLPADGERVKPIARELAQTLDRLRPRQAGNGSFDVDTSTRDHLEDLGYL